MTDVLDQFRYQTWELDEMVRTIERPNPFLLNMWFGSISLFETAVIEFDVQEGGKRLAPFVSPLGQGRPVSGRGFSTKQFRPAYIKPKRTVTPAQAFTRMPGEAYGGSMSPKQRIDRLVAEEIAEHADMIDNRLEWMAAQVLTGGSVTVAGDDYQSQLVDYGQNSNLRTTASVQWDQTTADPLADIETVGLNVRKYSYGAVADTVVMDGQAWGLFRAKMVDNRNFSTTRRVGSSSIESGPRSDIDGEQVGTLAGRYSLWVYDGRYEDNSGVMQPYMPAYGAFIGNPKAIMGKQYFGAIMDLANNLVPTKHFVSTNINFDPSGVEVLSQSAPLVGPKRPNAVARLTTKT